MTQEDYLAHHGILGQKWGVRRYQNPDGSLTSEGRKRRGLSEKSDGVNKALKTIKKIQKNRKREKARKAEAMKEARAEAEQEAIKRKAEKAVEEHEKLKESLRRHPRDIYKNRGKLTQEDVDEIMKGVQFDRKCKDIKRDEYLRGLRVVQDTGDTLKYVSAVMANGINAYNNIALISNALVDAGIENGTINKENAKKLKKLEWPQKEKKKGED
jgi:hypothetical protein